MFPEQENNIFGSEWIKLQIMYKQGKVFIMDAGRL